MERIATTRTATMERNRLPALRLRFGSLWPRGDLGGVAMCSKMRRGCLGFSRMAAILLQCEECGRWPGGTLCDARISIVVQDGERLAIQKSDCASQFNLLYQLRGTNEYVA
jgi:hypothetical protein